MGWLPDGPLNIDYNIYYFKAFHYLSLNSFYVQMCYASLSVLMQNY